MYSDLAAIDVSNVSKSYRLYDRPQDGLKQSILPTLQRLWRKVPPASYREVCALKNICFRIKKGETVGIIGRNGSGKSTLVQIVCGTLHPTAGSVETFGRVAALLELGAGFDPDFTGRENVYLNATVLGLSRAEIDDRFDDIAAFADIGQFMEQPLKTFSSGMYTRLAFSVLANVNADILVIDEALAVGDAFFVQKCMRFLRKFQQHGTILFVSHDTAAVTSLCDRAIWLDHGVIAATGTAKEVCEEYFGLSHLEASGLANSVTTATRARPHGRNTAAANESAAFGTGEATIVSVDLLDGNGISLGWIEGGEEVEVVIQAVCNKKLEALIMGFHIKDRLGQPLIGDNTYLAYESVSVSAQAGNHLEARFAFTLPLLASGNYSISAAIASGTPSLHVQHHWIHDALVFTVHSTSLTGVLVGVPMKRIALAVRPQPAADVLSANPQA